MAIAVEALPAAAEAAEGGSAAAGAVGTGRQEAAPWRAVSAASGQARKAPGAASRAARSVSTPSAAAKTVTRLIWAVALGLIALEIAAEATGQKWTFNLPSLGKGPAPKTPYVPLYAGQGQTSQAGAAMPWIPVTVVNPTPGQTTPGASSGGSLLQP